MRVPRGGWRSTASRVLISWVLFSGLTQSMPILAEGEDSGMPEPKTGSEPEHGKLLLTLESAVLDREREID